MIRKSSRLSHKQYYSLIYIKCFIIIFHVWKLFNSYEYCMYQFIMSESKCLSMKFQHWLCQNLSLKWMTIFICLTSTYHISSICYPLSIYHISFCLKDKVFKSVQKDITSLCKQFSKILENIFHIGIWLSVHLLQCQNMAKGSNDTKEELSYLLDLYLKTLNI